MHTKVGLWDKQAKSKVPFCANLILTRWKTNRLDTNADAHSFSEDKRAMLKMLKTVIRSGKNTELRSNPLSCFIGEPL